MIHKFIVRTCFCFGRERKFPLHHQKYSHSNFLCEDKAEKEERKQNKKQSHGLGFGKGAWLSWAEFRHLRKKKTKK